MKEIDYLKDKKASETLCRKLRSQYRSMNLTNVEVWVEPFDFAGTEYWAIRSDLTKKHPELFQF